MGSDVCKDEARRVRVLRESHSKKQSVNFTTPRSYSLYSFKNEPNPYTLSKINQIQNIIQIHNNHFQKAEQP
jgi:hypothetical protein